MQEWVFPQELLRGGLCRALSGGNLRLGASSVRCQGRLQHPWVLQASKASTQQGQALPGLCRFSPQPSKSPLQELEVPKQKGLCWKRPLKERSTQEAAGTELSDSAQSRESKRAFGRAVTPPASSLPCSALVVPPCSPRAPARDAGSQPTEWGRVGAISPALTPPAQRHPRPRQPPSPVPGAQGMQTRRDRGGAPGPRQPEHRKRCKDGKFPFIINK